MKRFIKDIHAENLPTIRITGITMDNFKNVKHGEITFHCGRRFVPYGTQSDILGLYGQNGSGKTSLIEAISIVKYLISGKSVPDQYADCINVEAEYAQLTFSFEFQYPEGNNYESNNDKRKVVYSFKMSKVQKTEEEMEEIHLFADEILDAYLPNSKYQVKVFDEILKVGGTIGGETNVLKPFIDTTNKSTGLGPKTRIKSLLGDMDEETRIQVGISENIANSSAKSLIFLPRMLALYRKYSNYSTYYQMIIEMHLFGRYYLHVIDTKSLGLSSSLVTLIPFYDGSEMEFLPINEKIVLDEKDYQNAVNYFDKVSLVLEKLVPGLTLGVKDYGRELQSTGEEGHSIDVIAKRNGVEIPLRCESEGIRKLVFTLQHLIMVYNQHLTTVVYDEFDSGIFEYLLGEIIQIIQESGKGQFIFTSHNMRPLEVLRKEFVWFTTTDEYDRYTRLSGLAESNNLRRVYYREIAIREKYDNLYDETKKTAIVSAMRKAGGK